VGPYLVGIDSGTQSVRVIVFDLKGQVVAEGSARHNPIDYPRRGEAEQDPCDLWEKLCLACRRALDSLHGQVNELSAASLASQRSVMVPVDQDGNPLRPAFSWLDQRQTAALTAPPGLSAEQREVQRRSKANWMKLNQPDLYERAAWFLSASGWLTYRLCGQFRDSIGGLGGAFPLDVNRLSWSDDPTFYRLLGMPRQRLPEVFPPGCVLGHISPEAARQTGLPEGLPLVAGAGDKSSEMLGAGAITPAQGYVSYGTLAALEIMLNTPVFSQNGEYWTTPGAVRDTWNLEFGIECGYLMVSWFCEEFGGREHKVGAQALTALEDEFAEQAANIPPGAGGLVLAPYWSRNGIVPNAKSVLLGLEKKHTRAHLFRAILEGIAFSLREGMEVLARDTGHTPQEFSIGGGGAQSDLAVQITADVLGLPVVRVQTIQTCALGAAIEAAVGAGLYQTYTEAVAQMSRREQVFLPDPGRQSVYDAIYTRIYRKLYPALGKIFTEFNHIFESPEARE
jgi:sugar (pentulose or hexulose) kinase